MLSGSQKTVLSGGAQLWAHERGRGSLNLIPFLLFGVAQNRRKPLLHHGDVTLLPFSVRCDLVLGDLTNGEVLCLGVGKNKSGDGRCRPHRLAVRQLRSNFALDIEELPHRGLLGVVRLGRVPWRWANALVFDLVQAASVQRLCGSHNTIASEEAPYQGRATLIEELTSLGA